MTRTPDQARRITDAARRRLLQGSAGLAATAALPRVVRAQAGPLRLGVLTPLTGAGGNDGPRMLKAMEAVVDEVNQAGGVLGRTIELVVEDDQTNPEAAVRAARKLIEVDKVPVIMGTWASAVTAAVAPVCWESKTFLTTVSGADSITLLPHQGYLIRTQPNSSLQSASHGEFIGSLGARKVFVLGVQAPFAVSTREHLDATLRKSGGSVVGFVTYEKDKPTYRSEVDQAIAAKPDFLYLNGYAPDTLVVLRDLYKAGVTLPEIRAVVCHSAKVARCIAARCDRKLLHRAAVGRHRWQGLPVGGQATGHRRTRFLCLTGHRLDQHRAADHRQGRPGRWHGTQGECAQRHPGIRAEGGIGNRRAGLARPGQSHQLRRCERPLRLHRHRRYPVEPVPLSQGGQGQVDVRPTRLSGLLRS